MVLRVQCTDEGSPDILLSVGTEPQPTLLSSGVTRDSRNMLSPWECIWLHDKPLSFSSPCQPGYLKGIWESPQKARDGHTITFQSSLYFNQGSTGDIRMGCIFITAYTGSICLYLRMHARVHLFAFPDAYLLLGEWWQWHSMQADHLSCQVQVADSI